MKFKWLFLSFLDGQSLVQLKKHRMFAVCVAPQLAYQPADREQTGH